MHLPRLAQGGVREKDRVCISVCVSSSLALQFMSGPAAFVPTPYSLRQWRRSKLGYAVHINGVQTLCVSLEELDVSEAAAELVSSPAQDARMLVVTDARHDIRFMKTPGCSCDQPHETKFPSHFGFSFTLS